MTNLDQAKTVSKTFWNQLESKSKSEIEQLLISKFGEPTNELQTNLLFELTKKINSYYQPTPPLNYTIYSLIGSLTSPKQIIQKEFKEGKRMGQTFYILNLGNEKLQALQENLTPEKWQQIEKMAIIGQELVFKYKKWITNKQLLDWQPQK